MDLSFPCRALIDRAVSRIYRINSDSNLAENWNSYAEQLSRKGLTAAIGPRSIPTPCLLYLVSASLRLLLSSLPLLLSCLGLIDLKKDTMTANVAGWKWTLIVPIVAAALLLIGLDGIQPILSGLGLTEKSEFSYRPAVKIKQGTIIGRLVTDGTFPEPLEGFLGIPYAAPPVGDLRFRAAVPVTASNDTFEAFYLGPRSV